MQKKFISPAIVFIISIIYFYLSYSFYLPLELIITGESSTNSEINLYFDSSDGYNTYEKIIITNDKAKSVSTTFRFDTKLLLPNLKIKKVRLELDPKSIDGKVEISKLSLSANKQNITKDYLVISKSLTPEIGTSEIITKKFHLGIFILQLALASLLFYTTYLLQQLPKRLNKQSWKETLRCILFEEKRSFFWIVFFSSLIIHTLWLLAYWPAAMTNDSWSSYYEIRSLNITDWHPYIYTIYLMSLLQFYNSLASVAFFQILITCTICSYIFYHCYKRSVSLILILPFVLLFITSIPIGLFNIIIWKDVPYSIMILLLSFVLYLVANKRENTQGFINFPGWSLLPICAALVLLLHSRHNGQIFYLFLPLLFFRSLSKKHFIHLLAILVISFVLVKKVVPTTFQIKAPAGSAYHELKTILSIMTHFNYYSKTRTEDKAVVTNFVEDSWENIEKNFPKKWFSINDKPAVVRHQFSHKPDDPTNLKKSFIVRLILENIPIFLSARTFELLHSIGLDSSFYDARTDFYEDPLQFQGNNLNPPGNMIFNISIKADSKLPNGLKKIIDKLDGWSRTYDGIFSPSFIIWNLAVYMVFFLFIAFKEQGTSSISLFTLPSWISLVGIFLLGPGESWRYFYYFYLCGIVSVPLYFDYLKNRKSHTN